MRLEKIQDHISLLDNLNKGDILIFSKNEFADDIKIMPDNIYWVNYRNNTVVSLKSFNKGEKKFDYNELKQDFWYILRLSLYLSGYED